VKSPAYPITVQIPDQWGNLSIDEGAAIQDPALTHGTDEFPPGYSSAGCAPAKPASALPAEAQLARKKARSTRQFQRRANRVLPVCLSPGDNPSRYPCANPGRSAFRFQAIARTTLPGNISPPEPTDIQASKSRDYGRSLMQIRLWRGTGSRCYGESTIYNQGLTGNVRAIIRG
jgi:hypothetical protein